MGTLTRAQLWALLLVGVGMLAVVVLEEQLRPYAPAVVVSLLSLASIMALASLEAERVARRAREVDEPLVADSRLESLSRKLDMATAECRDKFPSEDGCVFNFQGTRWRLILLYLADEGSMDGAMAARELVVLTRELAVRRAMARCRSTGGPVRFELPGELWELERVALERLRG